MIRKDYLTNLLKAFAIIKQGRIEKHAGRYGVIQREYLVKDTSFYILNVGNMECLCENAKLHRNQWYLCEHLFAVLLMESVERDRRLSDIEWQGNNLKILEEKGLTKQFNYFKSKVGFYGVEIPVEFRLKFLELFHQYLELPYSNSDGFVKRFHSALSIAESDIAELDEDGYFVHSQSENVWYQIDKSGRCTCPDFAKRAADSSFLCKHKIAIMLAFDKDAVSKLFQYYKLNSDTTEKISDIAWAKTIRNHSNREKILELARDLGYSQKNPMLADDRGVFLGFFNEVYSELQLQNRLACVSI